MPITQVLCINCILRIPLSEVKIVLHVNGWDLCHSSVSPVREGHHQRRERREITNIWALILKGRIYHNLNILALNKCHSNGKREERYRCLIFQRKNIQELCLENSDRGNSFGKLFGDTGERQLKFSAVRLQTLGNRKFKLGFVFCVRE